MTPDEGECGLRLLAQIPVDGIHLCTQAIADIRKPRWSPVAPFKSGQGFLQVLPPHELAKLLQLRPKPDVFLLLCLHPGKPFEQPRQILLSRQPRPVQQPTDGLRDEPLLV